MEHVLKRAIKYYGEEHQLMKVAEECNELAKECLKNKVKNIIEEAADVTIMIEQLRLMSFWNEELFQKEIRYKVNRLNEYINIDKRKDKFEKRNAEVCK